MNILAGWLGFVAGAVAGAVQGLFFHREDWLGGYASWARRMTRLGHVAFFGLGLINLAFAFTTRDAGLEGRCDAASYLLIVALIAMPALCYTSAFWNPARRLFIVPVLCVVVAAGLVVRELLR